MAGVVAVAGCNLIVGNESTSAPGGNGGRPDAASASSGGVDSSSSSGGPRTDDDGGSSSSTSSSSSSGAQGCAIGLCPADVLADEDLTRLRQLTATNAALYGRGVGGVMRYPLDGTSLTSGAGGADVSLASELGAHDAVLALTDGVLSRVGFGSASEPLVFPHDPATVTRVISAPDYAIAFLQYGTQFARCWVVASTPTSCHQVGPEADAGLYAPRHQEFFGYQPASGEAEAFLQRVRQGRAPVSWSVPAGDPVLAIAASEDRLFLARGLGSLTSLFEVELEESDAAFAPATLRALEAEFDGKVTRMFADGDALYWSEQRGTLELSYRCVASRCVETKQDLLDDAGQPGALYEFTRNDQHLFFTVGRSRVRRVLRSGS